MIRRALLVCLFAASPAAAEDGNRAVEIALANALHRGDAKTAAALFDSKMPEAAGIRADVQQLVRGAEVALEINPTTGVWSLNITSRDAAAGVTRRQAKVKLRAAAGLIAAFEPVDFFEPPHSAGAWNTVYSFAAALNDDAATPALDQFDRDMPQLTELKSAVLEIWNRYQIDASLDLLSNEGDDDHRTLRIDWTLNLENRQDPVDSTRREQIVVCHLDRREKEWRIVSFDPISFFMASKK